jgi:hypothetical protein
MCQSRVSVESTAAPCHESDRVDAETGEVTTWTVPMPDTRSRRIDIDCDRNIWFAEFQAGKIGRFYRKTQTSKERPLPGSKSGHIAMMKMRSAVGRLDPDTGKRPNVFSPIPNSRRGILPGCARAYVVRLGRRILPNIPSKQRRSHANGTKKGSRFPAGVT